MALGGGFFNAENKVLPGSYINFVSTKNTINVFGERGVAAIVSYFHWFPGDKMVEVTAESLLKNSLEIFGEEYGSPAMAKIRDFFKHGKKLYLYMSNYSTAKAAECVYCTARNRGKTGNELKVSIQNDVDTKKKLVNVYLRDKLVSSQKVTNASELEDNGFVIWKDNAELTLTTGVKLTGGDSGTASIDDISKFLSAADNYYFNIIAANNDAENSQDLLLAYTKRMREEVGKKFQCLLFNCEYANYEGCVKMFQEIKYAPDTLNTDILFWAAGALAGCPVNKSLTNMKYDGSMAIATDTLTQSTLEKKIKEGIFVLHKVGDDIRVLLDINSLVDTTEEKGEMFKDNQTIRVIDQIAEDIAAIFNDYYLGKVPNDVAGRNSLWCDIVKHHEKLEDMRAIEDFSEEDVVVEKGESKRSVVVYDCITPVNAMAQLYMKVTVE